MKPILKQVDAFTVAGISVRTANADEASPETGKLGPFWGRFFQENISGQVTNQVAGSLIYGVYSDYESDVNGLYTVTAGVQVQPSASSGDDFARVEVAAGEYLVFEGHGAMPQVVIETWQKVWAYFSQPTEFTRAYTTDFELYRGMDEVAIHIGVSQNGMP